MCSVFVGNKIFQTLREEMSTVASEFKYVGSYRVLVCEAVCEVVVEEGGGVVAVRGYKNAKKARQGYNELTNRDKVDRFVRDNS